MNENLTVVFARRRLFCIELDSRLEYLAIRNLLGQNQKWKTGVEIISHERGMNFVFSNKQFYNDCLRKLPIAMLGVILAEHGDTVSTNPQSPSGRCPE